MPCTRSARVAAALTGRRSYFQAPVRRWGRQLADVAPGSWAIGTQVLSQLCHKGRGRSRCGPPGQVCDTEAHSPGDPTKVVLCQPMSSFLHGQGRRARKEHCGRD